MNKKIISLVATAAMCASTITVPLNVTAADFTTIHEAIIDLFKDGEVAGDNHIKYDASKDCLVQDGVEVPANMQVRRNGDTEWKEGFNSNVFGINIAAPIRTISDEKFDYRTYLDMSNVYDLYSLYISKAKSYIGKQANKDELQKQLDDVKVEGEFDVTIKFDSDSTSMYDEVKTLSADDFQDMFKLAKWDDAAKDYTKDVAALDNLYKVDGVTPNDADKSIVVALKVYDKDTSTYGAKQNRLDTYLQDDIILQKDALTAKIETTGSTYTTIGTVTGYTNIVMSENSTLGIAADKTIAYIEYNAKQDSKYDDDTSKIAAKVELVYGTPTPTETPAPTRKPGTGGGGGSVIIDRPTAVPTVAPTVTPIPDDVMVPVPDKFEAEKHYEYIIGYDDGTVKPFGNITREEVATIFYRMLKSDIRENMFANTNSFSDVSDDRWSNNAISTLTRGNILEGYEDGRFRPGAYITRAEFVTIATRFYKTVNFKGAGFDDIIGHWAESNIENAVYYKLINGYSDGTFRPNADITRAEVMVIVNNILNREVDEQGILAEIPDWSDNAKGEWYYYDVLEATRPHDYERREAGRVMENWTKLNSATDWEALEKTWTVGNEVTTDTSEK